LTASDWAGKGLGGAILKPLNKKEQPSRERYTIQEGPCLFASKRRKLPVKTGPSTKKAVGDPYQKADELSPGKKTISIYCIV